MINKDGYEIYTRPISKKDFIKFKKKCKKIGAMDEDGKIDFLKIFNKEDINENTKLCLR